MSCAINVNNFCKVWKKEDNTKNDFFFSSTISELNKDNKKYTDKEVVDKVFFVSSNSLFLS